MDRHNLCLSNRETVEITEAIMPETKAAKFMPKLIFDIGMHKGEDSEYYLKKGFDVVAFEAHPDLVSQTKKSYAQFIRDKRLRIIEGAIVPDPGVEFIVFYQYADRTKWGTIESDVVRSSAKRAKGVSEIRVPVIDFASVIRKVGMPYYMKIDIEGADIHCLEVLKSFDTRPAYLSIEAIEQDIGNQTKQIELLCELGYDRFKAVQQARMHRRVLPALSSEGRNVEHEFAKGSSGPFGSDLGGEWRSGDEILSDYERIFRRNRRVTQSIFWKTALIRKPARRAIEFFAHTTIPGWYDTHALHSAHEPPVN
jgi:FkbM family methyltransferase